VVPVRWAAAAGDGVLERYPRTPLAGDRRDRHHRPRQPAWGIGGLNNRPGYLATANGRLTFTDGEPYFDVPLADIRTGRKATTLWREALPA
jgi:hypothetical protein